MIYIVRFQYMNVQLSVSAELECVISVFIHLLFRRDGTDLLPVGPTAQTHSFNIQISSYWRDIV